MSCGGRREARFRFASRTGSGRDPPRKRAPARGCSPVCDVFARQKLSHSPVNSPRESERGQPPLNLNADAERWVRSVKQGSLDHFVVLGEEHLRHIVTEYAAHYNQERPHQARDNHPPSSGRPTGDAPGPAGAVVCEERLGGLLKHYRRAA